MATATRTIYADLIQIIDSQNPDTAGTSDTISGPYKSALMHFTCPSDLLYKTVTKIELYLWSTPVDSASYLSFVRYLKGPFDSSVTYNTAPEISSAQALIIGNYQTAQYNSDKLTYAAEMFPPGNVFNFGIIVSTNRENSAELSTSTTWREPYIVLTYSTGYDDKGYVWGNPYYGYIPKNQANTFRYTYDAPENIPAGELTVSSWRLLYKKSSAGYYSSVDVGSEQSYTFPAGTFSDTNVVYWYPELTFDTGASEVPRDAQHATIVFQLSTNEPTFTSVAASPNGTIEDGSGPIEFRWTSSNSAGTSPSGAELQYSADGGTSWTDFASITGSARKYVLAANTLPAGELAWRVRTINNEGTAGAWSSALNFICVSAPASPSVNTDGVPFATITWDATGQQAYEVTIDDVSYGVHFGSEKTFTLPLPLSDGNHNAAVKVQGTYGLWSEPGSVQFSVQNEPNGTVQLFGQFGVDAVLTWENYASGDNFLVFRDGVQIGHTAGNDFTDRRAVGDHAWFVLLRLTSGNYTKSNVVSGALTLDAPVIAPLAGGPWISLRLTDSGMAQQQFKYARTHTLRHFSGSPLPVLELTPYEDYSGTLQCAFPSDAEARPFEALRGQVVILKTRETVLIGGLMNLSKIRNPLYVAYQFTIEQIAVEEIVDDPGS